MSDPSTSGAPSSRQEELSGQITRSLSAVWQHHSGVRPDSLKTEVRGSRVRCMITEGKPAADGEERDAEAAARSTDSRSYESDAVLAVSRATKRRVMGFIQKRDKETDVLTETFILQEDTPRL